MKHGYKEILERRFIMVLKYNLGTLIQKCLFNMPRKPHSMIVDVNN